MWRAAVSLLPPCHSSFWEELGVLGHTLALRNPRSGAVLSVSWTTEDSGRSAPDLAGPVERACGQGPVCGLSIREMPGRAAAHSCAGCSLPNDKAPGGTEVLLTSYFRSHMS